MLIEKTFNIGSLQINYGEGPDNGDPMVLIHGATLNWQNFGTLLPDLTPQWHVYACDARGHGKSGRVPGQYRITDFVDDTVAFIKNKVSKPATLIGHSNGGMIALGVAAQIPDLIKAVILLDPSIAFRNANANLQDVSAEIHGWFLAINHAFTSNQPIAEMLLSMFPDMDKVGLENATNMIQGIDPKFVTAMLANSFFEGFSLESTLQKISCPTLMLYGELALGSIVRESDVAFLKANLPNAVVVQMKGVGHGPHEQQTTQAMDHIHKFLLA